MEHNLNTGWLGGKGNQLDYLVPTTRKYKLIRSGLDSNEDRGVNALQSTPLSRSKKLDYYLDQSARDRSDTPDIVNRSKNKKLRDWIKRSNKLWIVGSNGKGIIIQ